ncbi:hypothetical protein RJ639_044246 [Escallonia herrerae]|uniref:Reverse transcriptase Ty1/copia-type domain-containing protein n=1 Tax=Escallonia herrerae TaxID=1293975 RepID=A0AA88WCW9_9ASTE|nr:hypothetical protein RJ639_044246 [Escallonia herrerae]
MDPAQPIFIILDGEPQLKFDERLDDWDRKNHQIITWFRNTSVLSVYQQFGRYNTANEIWDLLAQRYITADLAHQYQLHDSLHRMRQEPGSDLDGIYILKQDPNHHFEMKDLGILSYFLGLEVFTASDGYYLSQAKYASDLLSCVGLTDSKTASSPLEPNVRFIPLDGTPLHDPTLYRTLVGSLVYLTVTRPNIAYVVHLVSQFLFAPHTTQFHTVLHILRYIKGTLFHGLHFSSNSSLELHAYSNADWAGDPTDRLFTTGFCFFLGTSIISRRSKKQTLTTRSSTKS